MADNDPHRRKARIALALLGVVALPLGVVAVALLFNPYALLFGSTFSVRNDLVEAVVVTPLAAVRTKEGTHHWKVLPLMVHRFVAAPAYPRARAIVLPGQTVRFHANFDDASLAVIAVESSVAPPRALMVDREAAMGGCCYAPRRRVFGIASRDLVPVEPAMIEVVAAVDDATPRALGLAYGLVVAGLGLLAAFVVALRRYRALAGQE
jgi:hypothetical protein